MRERYPDITWRECLPEAIALNSAEITNEE